MEVHFKKATTWADIETIIFPSIVQAQTRILSNFSLSLSFIPQDSQLHLAGKKLR